MSKIIAISNQKGGTGKSSTAAVLLSGLTLKGYKALAVDLDAQGNLSFTVGVSMNNKTALELLTKECTAKEVIQHTTHGDMIAASSSLATIDMILDTRDKLYRLKKSLEVIKRKYDFILIDCPPSLGTLTANALTAAHTVLIPAQADIFSIQGIAQLWNTIQAARESTNPNLEVAGVLLTRYSNRATLSRELESDLRENITKRIGSKTYTTTIRDGIAVKEAQYMHEPLFTYAPKANVTEDYKAFMDEFLEDMKQ